ncbi:hypothetical protein ACFQ0X_20930 [Streptomyces rectiviolaceus]|uniref:Uncharacterized protein n=1 Tax=Streptomyces rectiviolaceus TaxID=332591 RepID=A0ABP6NMC8_9ACTN
MPPGSPARYPYPFLDVEVHGYAGVLANAVLFGLDRIRPGHRDAAPGSQGPKTGFRLRAPVR